MSKKASKKKTPDVPPIDIVAHAPSASSSREPKEEEISGKKRLEWTSEMVREIEEYLDAWQKGKRGSYDYKELRSKPHLAGLHDRQLRDKVCL
jgi:hypothetical protein